MLTSTHNFNNADPQAKNYNSTIKRYARTDAFLFILYSFIQGPNIGQIGDQIKDCCIRVRNMSISPFFHETIPFVSLDTGIRSA